MIFEGVVVVFVNEEGKLDVGVCKVNVLICKVVEWVLVMDVFVK